MRAARRRNRRLALLRRRQSQFRPRPEFAVGSAEHVVLPSCHPWPMAYTRSRGRRGGFFGCILFHAHVMNRAFLRVLPT